MTEALLAAALSGFIPNVHTLATNFFDKVGFDGDAIGREREISHIVELARKRYYEAGIPVNIAVWNMHLDVHTRFGDPILETGIKPMGNGGGFRVVIFQGAGRIENNGARGYSNWHCYGNCKRTDNVITFEAQS